ncbi:MAG TPA: hypothetical protein DDW25_02260, partial [Ktedonobacter sp.]|nr:hypothetical protein [Ktedonobacter sp.]
MISNNDAQQSGARESGQRPNAIYAPVPLHTPASTPYPAPRRHLLRTMLISALLIMLVASAVAAGALAYSAGNQVSVRIGNQQSALIDLRQSFPISPYLLGANVFPATSTLATDQVSSGFMSYGSHVTNGLRSAHVKLLRFPGGDWGELHAYSFDQLNAFSNLLGQVNADGMIQVPLSDPSGQAGSTGSLASRASNAGLTVDY